MHILNVMLGKGAGGVEQAAIDYHRALTGQGHRVTNVTRPGAWVDSRLDALGAERLSLPHLGEWDPLARYRLRRIMRTLAPDAVIAHSNRALGLCTLASRRRWPVVAVTHNYSIRRVVRADAAMCITRDLCARVIALGLPEARVFHIPNMVEVDVPVNGPEAHHPPVIGSMGRFVAKKGFDVMIDALALLRRRGTDFRAVLGGSGEGEAELRARAVAAGLGDSLAFAGWIDDRDRFFAGIDLFCLPSHHEPFGIVAIEAFAHGVALVSTASEGPREIIDGENGILVPLNDAPALAEALAALLANDARRAEVAAAGRRAAVETYSIAAGGRRLSAALSALLGRTA
ncbi:glycosyltransferase [Zavarzinia sp.]|uniref:glycosyltransferase n=1 Tax=Zavarzinia sp. TaxID=2027920 RepID=UPI003564E5C3